MCQLLLSMCMLYFAGQCRFRVSSHRLSSSLFGERNKKYQQSGLHFLQQQLAVSGVLLLLSLNVGRLLCCSDYTTYCCHLSFGMLLWLCWGETLHSLTVTWSPDNNCLVLCTWAYFVAWELMQNFAWNRNLWAVHTSKIRDRDENRTLYYLPLVKGFCQWLGANNKWG